MTASFVLDCSIAMSWCFEDEFDEYSQKILNQLDKFNAIVPPLFFLEVSSMLLNSEKRGRLSVAHSTRFIEILDSSYIHVSDLNFSVHEIINTARACKLTPYDTIYLMLAMHSGLPITTKDQDLRRACLENGVNIFALD